jgi:hypothetical protein
MYSDKEHIPLNVVLFVDKEKDENYFPEDVSVDESEDENQVKEDEDVHEPMHQMLSTIEKTLQGP